MTSREGEKADFEPENLREAVWERKEVGSLCFSGVSVDDGWGAFCGRVVVRWVGRVSL